MQKIKSQLQQNLFEINNLCVCVYIKTSIYISFMNSIKKFYKLLNTFIYIHLFSINLYLKKVRCEAAIQAAYSFTIQNVFEHSHHGIGRTFWRDFGLQARSH